MLFGQEFDSPRLHKRESPDTQVAGFFCFILFNLSFNFFNSAKLNSFAGDSVFAQTAPEINAPAGNSEEHNHSLFKPPSKPGGFSAGDRT